MQDELNFPPLAKALVETPAFSPDEAGAVSFPLERRQLQVKVFRIVARPRAGCDVLLQQDWASFDAAGGYSRADRDALWTALCRLLVGMAGDGRSLPVASVASDRVWGLDGQGFLLSFPGVTPLAVRLLARFLYVSTGCRVRPNGGTVLWPVKRPKKRLLRERAG